jgi:hypothetical protein
MLHVKAPSPLALGVAIALETPAVTGLVITGGFTELLQHIPQPIIFVPPSEVTFPPQTAVDPVTEETDDVEIVALAKVVNVWGSP